MDTVPLDTALEGVPDHATHRWPHGPHCPFPRTTAGAAPQSPEELVLAYLSVADTLSRHFARGGLEAEDLCQVARMGLLKAAQRYREPLGHGFLPYAVPTIKGELKRYIRDQSWAVRPPRRLQEARLRLNTLRSQLAQQLGHEPTPRELATAAGIRTSDVAQAQLADAARIGQPLEHAETPFTPEERRSPAVPGQEDPHYARIEQLDALKHALSDASDQDRHLLTLRFTHEMTQEQIAHELNISQMQVSRLLRRILDRLRTRLTD
jgi:RNA polymerase sigma-B factor